MPEPLEVVGDTVNYEFIRMPDSTGFGDYTETGQVIPVRFKDKDGTVQEGGYVHAMYLDDNSPIAGGREIWGFPKKLATPKVCHENETLVCTLHYGSVLCVTATMGYKHREIDHAPLLKTLAKPSFMIKIIPHVDCTPRICELVRYYLEDVTVKGAWSGPAALQFFDHALCDVNRLPVREVVSASHFVTDLTLGLGEVVFDYLAKYPARKDLPMSLSKRVAIVTGAASGIGKEIALRFAAEGGMPVIADLEPRRRQRHGRGDQGQRQGAHAFAVAMNVVDEAQVEKGVADVMAKYGQIDILVSNAGIQIVKPLVDFPFADWKKLLSIHLDGAFLTTKACLKHMYAAKYGRVVYMGSVHSKEASKLKAPYVTAKHGLIGLSKVLAKEGAEYNVAANVVCPGFVRTPLVDKQIPEQAKELGISEEDVIKTRHAEGHGRRRVHHDRRRGRRRAVFRRRQQHRADRPVDGRQPRLVHAVGVRHAA